MNGRGWGVHIHMHIKLIKLRNKNKKTMKFDKKIRCVIVQEDKKNRLAVVLECRIKEKK